MRVMVFGGTGYLGGHIVAALQERGHEVRACVRSAESAAKLAVRNVECVFGDLLDEALDFAQLLRDVEAVVFAPQLLVVEEFPVVCRILDAMAGTSKAFVFTSGTGLLSQRTDGLWSEDNFAEDDAFVPNKYLATRAETEAAVRGASERGVRGIVLRPPSIWGNGGGDILKNFFLSAKRTGQVCYLGKGLNLYSNVHVEDLARLYGLALEHGAAGALYHAVAGELNNRSLAEAVARRLGLTTRSVDFAEGERIWGKFGVLIAMSMSSRTRCPRSRNELGWRAAHLDILDDIAHPSYMRILEDA